MTSNCEILPKQISNIFTNDIIDLIYSYCGYEHYNIVLKQLKSIINSSVYVIKKLKKSRPDFEMVMCTYILSKNNQKQYLNNIVNEEKSYMYFYFHYKLLEHIKYDGYIPRIHKIITSYNHISFSDGWQTYGMYPGQYESPEEEYDTEDEDWWENLRQEEFIDEFPNLLECNGKFDENGNLHDSYNLVNLYDLYYNFNQLIN